MNLFQAKAFGIIAFGSTQHAIGAEKQLTGKEIEFLLIPLPTGISATCGLALKFFYEDMETIKEILQKAYIPLGGIYYVIKEDKNLIVSTVDF